MKKNLLLFFTGLFAATTGFCQINIPANSLAKENFNAIGSTATATLPASWKMSSAGTGAASGYATGTNVTATTQAASSGTPTTGGRYNWAGTPGTDRAIGFMSDAGYADVNAIFADYKNTTGATITSVNLSYSIERYRINTGIASVALYSSTDGSTWTARTAGDISAAVFTPGASSYTFVSPQTVYKNITVSGISIANNSDIYFRWVFTTGGTASQGLALDDVVLFAPPAAPVVTGSMRDNLQVDNNADNQAGAGDQLRYTTVVRNTGTADATGVTFTNLTPANTTLNPGSVKTSALARDDSYSTPQNTLLNAATVLANDFGLPAPIVISFGSVSDPSTTANSINTAKSDNGGTVTMNTDGTFSYNPPAGFAGFDRFAYVATTGTAPDNAGVVTITVGSSVITTGAAESYNVTGNVSISTPNSGVGNLLNNDTGNGLAIGSVNGSPSSVGTPITTANGGTLTVNSNGSFTYNPAPGYEGADNFTYTVDNGFSNPSAPVTVTITIAGMIWFIDNNYAGTLTDGRLGSPFKTIAAFQGINDGTGLHPAVNDNIFIYESATDYNGNISLLNGQKLIGQDATGSLATLSGITLPLYSAALPVTNSANGTIVKLTTTVAATNAITLLAGASNTVRGLTIGNTTGAKLFSSGFGTLTIGDNTTPDVTLNGSGQAMSLTSGTFGATSGFVSVTSTSSSTQGINFSGIAGTVDFGSTNISGSGTQGILVGTTTATIDFGNTVVSAGTDGISFQNNSGANTKTFGTLSITTTGGFSSFLHSNGGGIVTAGVTTISNGTGNGIDIQNNITTVSFGTTTVTKSGAGNAVSIANTSGAAGNVTFSAVNLGTAGTRLTGPAINIVNTGGANTSVYDFGAVSIFTNAATGVIATNVNGAINMSSGTIDVTGAAAMNIAGPAGLTTLGMTLATVNSNGGTNNVNFTNCAGNATLNGGSLTGTAAGTTFNVTGGTLGLTYAGSITQAANAAMVGINGGHNTGTVNFTGALNATSGTGLQFDNADGTYNFTGAVTLNGGDAGIDIISGSSGTINISNTLSNINNPSGELIKINASSANLTYSGAFTKNNAATTAGILVSSETGGTVTINGPNTTKVISTAAQNAVNLLTNSGATVNFSGNNLLLTTSSGTGFNATAGGTVTVAGTGNTITSGAGTALNVNATTIGGANLNFLSINVNGASKGITLNGTGAGGLNVTGTGTTAGSGGTIQNISARGVEFISANNISLKNMNFVNANTVDAVPANTGLSTGNNLVENAVVYLQNITGITLDRINISGTSAEEGINGNTVSNFTLSNSSLINTGNASDEDGLHFYNMLGTNNITNTTITSSGDDNVNIQNASGTSVINVTGGSFNTGVLGSGLLFGPRASTNTTINISGVTCDNNFSGGIVSDCSDAATMIFNVSGSTSTNNNDGISISSASGTSQFDINGNTVNNNDFGPINVLKAAFSVNGLFEGRVRNNIITVENGKFADGMSLQNLGGGTLKLAVSGNNINYSGTQRGMYISGGQDGKAFIEGTVTGNTFDIKLDGAGNAVNAILAQVAVTTGSADGSTMCIDIGGAGALKNIFTHSLGGTLPGGDIRVRERNAGIVRIPGYAGGNTDTVAAGAYVDGRNTVVSPSTVTIMTTISGGAACAQPSN